jgi:hypothetical protein
MKKIKKIFVIVAIVGLMLGSGIANNVNAGSDKYLEIPIPQVPIPPM